MEDIELIIPEGKLIKSRIKELKKEKQRKNKKIIQCSILIILNLILVFMIIISLSKLTEKGINGCLENGYSYSYCISHS